MRDWTKTLLPASFKGFPFRVESESGENGGRRVVTHEYVRGESHDTEDMGRKAGSFSVKAYLASDGADADLEAFMSILSSPEAGMLVLPMHGATLANCTEVRSSSEKTKLGYVAFDLRFVKAMESFASPVIAALSHMAFSSAGSLASIIPTTLNASFSGARVPPAAAMAAAGEILTKAAEVVSTLASLAPLTAGAAAVDFDLRVVKSAISRAATVDALAAQVGVIATFIHDHASVADPVELQGAGLELSSGILSSVPATASLARANEQRLGKRIVQSLGLMLASEAAAATASRSFPSRDQARSARTAIIAAFDAALTAASDATEPVIVAARESLSSAVRHIDETAGDLAPLVKVDLPRSLPSTLIAWALYHDPSRAPDLVAAARTGTSLFMPTSIIVPAR